MHSINISRGKGFGGYHHLDKARFYLNAGGSLYELKSHLLIAQELGYFNESPPVSTNLDKSESIAGLSNTIDNLSLKLNNLITATRSLSKESQEADEPQ